MSKRTDIIKYDLDSYDKHCCLKPSLAMIAAAAFACRAYLLPLLIVVGSLKGGAHYEVNALLGEQRTLAMLTQLPALLVIYAMVRRKPSASAAARWIWKRGRLLLAASLVADLWLLAGGSELQVDVVGAFADDPGAFARIGIDVAVLLYLSVSTRVKDTFADFPIAQT